MVSTDGRLGLALAIIVGDSSYVLTCDFITSMAVICHDIC
jgi:hypothetical protein